MQIKKITVLGCGWLGLPLAKLLVAKGFNVLGSTTSQEKLAILQHEKIQPFYIKATPLVEGENMTTFFDTDVLVINIPPNARNNPNAVDFHTQQITSITEKAKILGTKKVIFISSTGIYADANVEINEEMNVFDQSNSSLALQSAEKILKNAFQNELIILRLAGLVGGNRLAGRFFAGKKDIPNGKAPINMLHLDDAIALIHQIIHQNNNWGETFNVCSDEHPEKQIFYTQQAQKQGFELPEFIDELLDWKIIANQKVKQKFDFSFKYTNPLNF